VPHDAPTRTFGRAGLGFVAIRIACRGSLRNAGCGQLASAGPPRHLGVVGIGPGRRTHENLVPVDSDLGCRREPNRRKPAETSLALSFSSSCPNYDYIIVRQDGGPKGDTDRREGRRRADPVVMMTLRSVGGLRGAYPAQDRGPRPGRHTQPASGHTHARLRSLRRPRSVTPVIRNTVTATGRGRTIVTVTSPPRLHDGP